MFVCLEFIFHLYGDVTIASEGLQIWSYARHLWPLISEGSLTRHCNTGLPFIMVISERTRDTYTCFRAFGSGAVSTWRLRSVANGIEPRSPACEANAATAAVKRELIAWKKKCLFAKGILHVRSYLFKSLDMTNYISKEFRTKTVLNMFVLWLTTYTIYFLKYKIRPRGNADKSWPYM